MGRSERIGTPYIFFGSSSGGKVPPPVGVGQSNLLHQGILHPDGGGAVLASYGYGGYGSGGYRRGGYGGAGGWRGGKRSGSGDVEGSGKGSGDGQAPDRRLGRRVSVPSNVGTVTAVRLTKSKDAELPRPEWQT